MAACSRRTNRHDGVTFRAVAQGWREGGCDADEPSQLPAHLAEVEVRIEVLHKVENVALGRALRVPPAAAIMIDDQDLALLAAKFEGTACAFFAVQTPRRRPPLEQRGAVHPSAELLELRILGLHLTVLLAERSRGWRVRHPLHFALRRTGDREAGGG